MGYIWTQKVKLKSTTVNNQSMKPRYSEMQGAGKAKWMVPWISLVKMNASLDWVWISRAIKKNVCLPDHNDIHLYFGQWAR
jgi:hypothetical protein